MSKLTLADINNLQNETTVVTQINNNSALIETALENTISRDGTSPNEMLADLDMNSYRILNLPAPTTDNQPIRKKEFDQAVFGEPMIIETPSLTYSSVADLVAETISSAVSSVFVLGHTTAGDGGEATYVKVSAEPEHDGKFSVVNDLGNTVWFELAKGTINPFMFGGIGDGVASDTAALKSFFAAGQYGYKDLYLPAGTWNHDSLTDRVQIFDVQGVTIRGAGRDATTIKVAGSNRPFCLRKLDGAVFRDIHVLSSKIASSYCLEVMNCANIVIENNHFEGGTIYSLGIYEDAVPIVSEAAQSGTHTLYLVDPNGNVTTKGTCTITTGTTTTVNFNSHGLVYGKLIKFTTTGTLPSPLAPDTLYEVFSTTTNSFSIVEEPLPCDNLIVRGNKFTDSGFYAIEHFPKALSNSCDIHDNLFVNCPNDPMNIGTAPYAIKAGQSTLHSRIFNNTIYCNNAAESAGIALGNFCHMEVFNNEVWDYDLGAINISAITHAITPEMDTFASCHIHDNTVGSTTGVVRDSTDPAFGFGSDETIQARMGPTIWENNTVLYDTGTQIFKIVPTSANATAQNGIQILNNKVYSDSAAQNMIEISNAFGGIPTGVEIRGNYFYGENYTSAIIGRYFLTGCESPTVADNTWVNAGRNVVVLSSCTGTSSILNNTINGYNVDNTASQSAFNITDTSSSSVYRITDNKFTTGNGHLEVIVSCGSSNPTFILTNNITDDVSCAQYAGSIVPTSGAFSEAAGRRWFTGTEAPASGGPYSAGDIVWNTSTAAAGNVGWVCTTAGSPGTWKTFGTIES